MTPPPQNAAVHLVLDANAVAAPVHIAALTCLEIVDFYLSALANADLSKKPPAFKGSFFNFRMTGPEMSAKDRRTMHESWILAKAFHELLRGVRASLEQAFLFIDLVSTIPRTVKSESTLDDLTAPILKKASDKNFPELLDYVNKSLQKPLDFLAAYQSLQNARNCLEHRGGVVGKKDVDGASPVMELSIPRMKVFYHRRGEEVEVQPGTRVNAEDGSETVELMMRLDVRRHHYNLGDRLSFDLSDFNEIAFACYYFGSQLASRLPALPK